jgi:hypothetical protein
MDTDLTIAEILAAAESIAKDLELSAPLTFEGEDGWLEVARRALIAASQVSSKERT